MDKKSKEALRRYKKSRQQARSSSDSSSSSDSDSGSSSSYSSSSSERKATERHRKKKARQAVAVASTTRRSSSTSGNERRKREKREHACQKKLEAKRNHLKRKLKEAKLKKRAAAAAAAAMSSHSHRNLSPTTQAKLKKLAERKQRAASKERREHEREKHRAAKREREHYVRSSRSPTKITKIRIHQDVKPRQKSPKRVHQQLMTREKIIIQARTRERTPSVERQRHEHKLRHHDHDALRDRERRDRERAEREAARDKERAEALARCQERQRERERIAREKLRREEEEKKYAAAGLVSERERERLLPRPAEREMAIAAARGYNSRERSLESLERLPRRTSQRELDLYEREREFLEAERRGLLDREELRREREYLAARRRELSPVSEHYAARLREERVLYADEERERAYTRAYLEEGRNPRDVWLDPRDIRERELRNIRDVREMRDLEQLRKLYPDEREHLARERDMPLSGRNEWKDDWPQVAERNRSEWDDGVGSSGGFVGGPVRSSTAAMKLPPREKRAPSEPDWDAEEGAQSSGREAGAASRASREKHPTSRAEHVPSDRRWQTPEWRDGVPDVGASTSRGNEGLTGHHLHRDARLTRGFRRGGHQEHGERNPTGGSSYRSHAPPSLMNLPVQPPGSSYHSCLSRFPSKRNMTYTNPNLIKKQQAALAAAKAAAQASAVAAATTAVAAAKAAAHSASNGTTNPGILRKVVSQSLQSRQQENAVIIVDKPEAGEIVGDTDSPANTSETENAPRLSETVAEINASFVTSAVDVKGKTSGELSEISDSDDDILDKEPSKAATPNAVAVPAPLERAKGEDGSGACSDELAVTTTNETDKTEKQDEEDLLDFEEISDGELEEDARNKGVGDALGVDWTSLIVETKRQAANANSQESEQITTAKQKWQPHRILLDVGISMRMAGESYAKQLLQDAKEKLDEELGPLKVKNEIKEEMSSTADEDSQTVDGNKISCSMEENKPNLKSSLNTLTDLSMAEDGTAIDVDRIHPMACIQVAERLQSIEKRTLIANACGAHSRALSARQDLKLRRQLCGLPAIECDLPRPLLGASNALKAKALAAFQRALEVK